MDTNRWADEGYVRLVAPLEQDEDGYPPSSSEGIWAIWLERDRVATIDSIPFYVEHLSLGDTVSVRLGPGGFLVDALVQSGGHSTIKVLVEDDAPPTLVADLRRALGERGCESEFDDGRGVVLVDIPPDVPFSAPEQILAEVNTAQHTSWWVSPLRHE